MDRVSFLHILERYSDEIEVARKKTLLNVPCYVCHELGHYALECAQKWRVVGNILRRLQKLSTFDLKKQNDDKLKCAISKHKRGSIANNNQDVKAVIKSALVKEDMAHMRESSVESLSRSKSSSEKSVSSNSKLTPIPNQKYRQ